MNGKSFPDNVLIIGSGMGGLSTALILSQLGSKTTVIEKNLLAGGLMRGYIRDGIECPVGVHYLGSLDHGQVLRRLFDFLGVSPKIPVEKMGANGIIDQYIFEDFAFNLPEGLDAYEENLQNAFPKEHRQITAIINAIRRNGNKMHALDFLFSTQNYPSMLEEIKPVGALLTELNCSPGLRAVLGVPCCWIGVPMASCPVFYHNMVLATYLFSSWRLKCSGAELVNVFSERLRSLGGNIIKGDGVEKILVNSRVVEGVQLQSGAVLKSPVVIGAVHPKVVLNMLPDGAVKPSYQRLISKLKDTDGMFCVHSKVDALNRPEIPHNIFKIKTEKNGDIVELNYYQIRKSEQIGKNLLTILTSGKGEQWKQWEHTKSGRRGEGYIAKKENRAWRLIREAEDTIGPMPSATLVDVYTPLTTRDWVNSPGGSAYGILRSYEQLLEVSILNRTSVKGLFLSGQNIMAPGILGTILGSFATVKLIVGRDRFFKMFRRLELAQK
ncbi:MAG: NAD(P)/FAD-dependent oxidoreductase [Desulfobacterales bacterium]|jgi:phytoene dehydrogenase-like protein|nr:NAD(P)/FAD-dependent oxidoreductase [Desulfobacterales bacterium]MDP6683554.1 NAD(P)/FAD-dependent oxidoreductase [Desulfobacterales bacterium]MDP6807380.1 NAD(P)/FAD-dependent oxidoreductase [Desulfobacterales bacterium]|tara:strand:+ start:20768 stop:22255 length:1488 start_codon:yes stop_codon:yes gene_type:complete